MYFKEILGRGSLFIYLTEEQYYQVKDFFVYFELQSKYNNYIIMNKYLYADDSSVDGELWGGLPWSLQTLDFEIVHRFVWET